MAETPDERVRRLEAELAAAQADQRVEHLQAQIAEARASAGDPPLAPVAATTYPATTQRRDARGEHVGRPSAPESPLAAPPRHVPLAFLAAAFSWRWWEAWALFMIAVTPIALWMGIPWTAPIAWTVTLVVAILLRLRSDFTNYRLLRNGVVADDVRLRRDSTGTYYSGVTYQNVRMAVAHGWRVEREWYSGPGTKSVLDFTVAGRAGTLTLHGLPYQDGVILADPQHPDTAKCVSEFPYDLDRDASGNWVGAVATRVWVGSFFTVALWGGWVLLILYWQVGVVR